MKRETQGELLVAGLFASCALFLAAYYDPMQASVPDGVHRFIVKLLLDSGIAMSLLLGFSQSILAMRIEGFMPPGSLLTMATLPFRYPRPDPPKHGRIQGFVLNVVTSTVLLWVTYQVALRRQRYWPRYDDAIDVLTELSKAETISTRLAQELVEIK